MDIAGGLAAAGNALTIAKAMRDAEKNFDAATFKNHLADLTSELADTKLALTDAKTQLEQAASEQARLKSAFEERAKLVEVRGGYKYKASEDGRPIGFPICPRCEQVDGRIVRLVGDGSLSAGKCPVCSTQFKPVTVYLPRDGGSETVEDAARIKSEADTAKIHRILSERGKSQA